MHEKALAMWHRRSYSFFASEIVFQNAHLLGSPKTRTPRATRCPLRHDWLRSVRPLKPLHFAANPLQPISQQLWADAVYVKDSADPAETHGGAVLGFYSGSGGDCPEAFGRKMKEPMK